MSTLPLNIGSLRHRVTIRARAAGVDAHGHPSTTWVDVFTDWADVRPIRGREYFAAGQVQSPVDVRIVMRYRDGVTPAMQAVWQEVPHDIVSVIDMQAKGWALELMCVAGARDGR